MSSARRSRTGTGACGSSPSQTFYQISANCLRDRCRAAVSFACPHPLGEDRATSPRGRRCTLAIFGASEQARPVARRAETTLDRLRRREASAWAELFEEHHPLVFRAVLAQVGNRQTAEDIAGQVFLEALEGIRRYRDRGRPISAWLLTIARHRSVDWLRRQGRERTGDVPDTPVAAHPAGEEAALQALARLTPEQREVVFLRFVEGYGLREIAVQTNRSVGAVKALQHRALQQLRAILEAEGGTR